MYTSRATGRSGVSKLTHLIRLDDLLVLAAFLRALGAFEGVDLLPTGEVNRLDTALGEQAVDGLGVAVDGHTAAFGRLARSSSMLVTIINASDLVEPIRPTGPRLAHPVAYRRSRTSPPAASVVMRPSPFALARWAPFSHR